MIFKHLGRARICSCPAETLEHHSGLNRNGLDIYAQTLLLRESAEVSVINAALAGTAEAVLDPDSTRLSSADGRGDLIRLAGWAKRIDRVKEVPVRVEFLDVRSVESVIPLAALPAPGLVRSGAADAR